MESDRNIAAVNGRADQPHVSHLTHGCGLDRYVESESTPVPERMSAQPLKAAPRVFGVVGERLLARDHAAAFEPEKVVDTTRPGQTAVRKVALPHAGVVKAKCTEFERKYRISHSRIEDVPQFEMSRLIIQGPTAVDTSQRAAI
jgi:hypothetical protein